MNKSTAQDKLKKQSDQQILRLLQDGSRLANLRRALSSGIGRAEQANAQRHAPTPVELRRQEFELALEVAGILGVDLSGDMETPKG